MSHAQENSTDITPDSAVIQNIVESAKLNVRLSSQLMPVFFVAGADNTINMVASAFEDDQDKDITAQFVRELAHKEKAKFVLFIAESYTIKDQDAAMDFMHNRHKYASVSEHPKAIEVVCFALETHGKQYMAIGEIDKERNLGDVKWSESAEAGGRFTNLLGKKPHIAKNNASTAVH